MIPPERIQERLAVVRAQMLALREATAADGDLLIDAPLLRLLEEEAEFLEVLAT